MSFWYVYLLEGAAGVERTVAPGCAAHYNVDECDLGRFLQYIWHARANAPEDTPRPKDPVQNLKNGKFETVDLSKVYNIIVGSKYVDGTDPQRLVGVSDYWKARSIATTPVSRIEEQYPENPVKPDKSDYDSTEAFKKANVKFRRATRVRQLISQAKKSSNMAYMLRVKDFEDYRINKGLLKNDYLGGKDIAIKTLQTGIDSQGGFNSLDVPGTLALHSENPDFEKELKNACREYRKADVDHYRAMLSGRRALANCNCDFNQVDGLRPL